MTKKTEEKIRSQLLKLNLMEADELTKYGKEMFRTIKEGHRQQNHIVAYTEDLLAICELFNIKTCRCLIGCVQLYGVDDNKLRDMYQVTNYKALIN